MEREKVSTFAAKFKKAFSEGVLKSRVRLPATVVGCAWLASLINS
jgi:hypothetical protein